MTLRRLTLILLMKMSESPEGSSICACGTSYVPSSSIHASSSGVRRPPSEVLTSPIGAYRVWLNSLIHPDSSTRFRQYTESDGLEGWSIVSSLAKDDKPFIELWDPEVTGDWTIISPCIPLPSESTAAESSIDEYKSGDFIDMTPEGLVRWAFIDSRHHGPHREDYRISVWRIGADKLLTKYSDDRTYLESVVSDWDEYDGVYAEIRKDVERTEPEFLRPRITNVLLAYAARNPSVGFCQGMSFVVSGLLQHGWVEDSDAFEFLSAIVEGVNINYYDSKLSGVHADILRLKALLSSKMHLVSPIPLNLALLEPMMCLFTRWGSLEASQRMFDIAFTQGREGLFAVYLALIDLTSSSVVAAMERSPRGEEEVNGLVQFKASMIRLLGDMDSLVSHAGHILLTFGEDIREILSIDAADLEKLEVVMSSDIRAGRGARPAIGSAEQTRSSEVLEGIQSGVRQLGDFFASSFSSIKQATEQFLEELDKAATESAT